MFSINQTPDAIYLTRFVTFQLKYVRNAHTHFKCRQEQVMS